jgi:membrane-associated protease RseP (regulator of RpoE activity)
MPEFVTTALSILITILIISLLVFIHEFGHFLAARAVGVKVEKFAIGFGPRVLHFTRGGTEFSVRLFLLGGYVQMLGDADASSTKKNEALRDNPESYLSKNVWQKLLITFAGVIVNFVFGSLVFMVYLSMVGNIVAMPKIGNYDFVGANDVNNAITLSPNFRAQGAPVGYVLDINGKPIESRAELIDVLSANYNQKLNLGLYKDNQISRADVVLNGDGIASNLDLDFFPNVKESTDLIGRVIITDMTDGQAFTKGKVLVSEENEDFQGKTAAELSKQKIAEYFLMKFDGEQVYSNNDLIKKLPDYLGRKANFEFINDKQQKLIIEVEFPGVRGKIPADRKFMPIDLFGTRIEIPLPGSTPEHDAPILGANLTLRTIGFDNSVKVVRYDNSITGGVLHAINVVGYNAFAITKFIGEAFQGHPQGLYENVGSVVIVGDNVNQILKLSLEFGNFVLVQLLNLLGLFSVILAFMNILPIPILDGGNAVIIIIEKLMGKPLPEKLLNTVFTVFFVAFILLTAVLVTSDIIKIAF